MGIIWELIIILNLAAAALFAHMTYRYLSMLRFRHSRQVVWLLTFSIFLFSNAILWALLVIVDLGIHYGQDLSLPVFMLTMVEVTGYLFLWKVSFL